MKAISPESLNFLPNEFPEDTYYSNHCGFLIYHRPGSLDIYNWAALKEPLLKFPSASLGSDG